MSFIAVASSFLRRPYPNKEPRAEALGDFCERAKPIMSRHWRRRAAYKAVPVYRDRLVGKCGAAGRGEALEQLLLAQGKGESPEWIFNEAIRLGRECLRVTGTGEAVLRDAEGWLYVIRREKRPGLNYGPRPPGRSG